MPGKTPRKIPSEGEVPGQAFPNGATGPHTGPHTGPRRDGPREDGKGKTGVAAPWPRPRSPAQGGLEDDGDQDDLFNDVPV